MLAAIGGWRQNGDKLRQLLSFVLALFRPSVVKRRLTRLRELGHIDVVPTLPQLLVAARDQMMVSAAEETRIFYREQGIPWVFHNFRRFLAGPATMLDPVGFFAPRDTIIHHVLQTFHRYAVYDLVLLRCHEDGLEEMARQTDQLLSGTHPHQEALVSLIEDGSYHRRLPGDIAAFRADPLTPARSLPDQLLADLHLMLGMDQFNDVRGYTSYAARLNVGPWDALACWLMVLFDETNRGLLGMKLGPTRVQVSACDPEIVGKRLVAQGLTQMS